MPALFGGRPAPARGPCSTSWWPPPDHPTRPPWTTAHRAQLPGAAAEVDELRRRLAPRASARATGSASGSRRAPPTCTSRSSAVLLAGAAYVPVDADDPDERAGWSSARPRSRAVRRRRPRRIDRPRRATVRPQPDARRAEPGRRRLDHLHLRVDRHAQGRRGHATAAPRRSSTPRPAVPARTPRSARATGCWPGSRSPSTPPARRCGWPGAHGACLVPAPRSLVRSGIDLGPWLVASGDHRRLDRARPWPRCGRPSPWTRVRLLIFGGEACPPELAERLAVDRRARSGTPTARPRRPSSPARALLDRRGPVRIGLPLDGWDLAVVDAARPAGAPGRDRRADHRRRRPGPLPRPGEGRREVRAACRSLGWDARLPQRRPGPRRARGAGLRRPRRRPGQARRPPDRARRGGRRAAGAARRAPAPPRPSARPRRGNQLLVGYVVTGRPTTSTAAAPRAAAQRAAGRAGARCWRRSTRCRPAPPARSTGTRCPGRWPAPAPTAAAAALDGHGRPGSPSCGTDVARRGGHRRRRRLLRPRRRQPRRGPAGLGGCATRYPGRSPSRDIYDQPDRSARSPRTLDALGRGAGPRSDRRGAPDPVKTQVGAAAAHWCPLRHPRGAALADVARALAALSTCRRRSAWAPHRCPGGGSWPAGCCSSAPPGRMAIGRGRRAAAAARRRARQLPARRLRAPAALGWPSGSPTSSAPPTSPGAPVAHLLRPGCSAPRSASDVDLHSLPPVTGMLTLGGGCAVEPEVDLDRLLDRRRRRCTSARSGSAPGATVGTRSTLLPGAEVGSDAEVAPGSRGGRRGPDGECWAGSPAERRRQGRADRGPRAARRARRVWAWRTASRGSALIALLPVLAACRRWLLRRARADRGRRRPRPARSPGAAVAAPLAGRWSGCVVSPC